MNMPEANLMKAVVIQSLKDYELARKKPRDHGGLKITVRDWVNRKEGSFTMCAAALDMTPEVLQEYLLKVLHRIDCGEALKIVD